MIHKDAILEVRRISVDKIFTPNYAKFRFDKLEEYYKDIVERPDGDFPLITVVPLGNGLYKIYDGRHRHLAAWMAKRETMPCVVITNQKEL